MEENKENDLENNEKGEKWHSIRKIINIIGDSLFTVVLTICITYCTVQKNKYEKEVEIRQIEFKQKCLEMENENLRDSLDYLKGILKEMGLEINEKE